MGIEDLERCPAGPVWSERRVAAPAPDDVQGIVGALLEDVRRIERTPTSRASPCMCTPSIRWAAPRALESAITATPGAMAGIRRERTRLDVRLSCAPLRPGRGPSRLGALENGGHRPCPREMGGSSLDVRGIESERSAAPRPDALGQVAHEGVTGAHRIGDHHRCWCGLCLGASGLSRERVRAPRRAIPPQ